MFEHHRQPLVSRTAFIHRMVRYAAIALIIVAGSLGLGILGYTIFEGLSWIDAFVNAAMLLGGMGPVTELHTPAGKAFAGFYALYSGLVFLLAAGVLFAPILHRIMHKFHLDMDLDEFKQDTEER